LLVVGRLSPLPAFWYQVSPAPSPNSSNFSTFTSKLSLLESSPVRVCRFHLSFRVAI
jgi:hypothetical protein